MNVQNTVDREVIVVGAGPVGLATATLLARAGRDVLVLERRDALTARDESRAITWMPEGLLLADELGITADLRARSSRRTSHEFRSRPDRRAFLTLRFDRLHHPHPYCLNLPQHDSELLIQEQAHATGRVEILRGASVTGAGVDGADVYVDVEHDGAIGRLRGRLGIAADGARSGRRGVAHSLGIPIDFADYGATSAVADVELRADPADSAVSWIALDARRPIGAFRFGERRWRLVYRVNDDDGAGATSAEFVSEIAARAWPSADIDRPLWASTFRLGQGQSRAYGSPPWFLVGDAAHAMGPSAGAGMMVGLLGAWRLARELSAHRDAAVALTAYEAAQRTTSHAIQRANRLIFRNLAVRGPAVGGLRNLALTVAGAFPGVASRFAAEEALVGRAGRMPASPA